VISNFDTTYVIYFIIAMLVVILALVIHALIKNHIATALSAFIGMFGYVMYSAYGPQWNAKGPVAIVISVPPNFYLSFNDIIIIPSSHTIDYKIFPILLTILIICCLFKLPGK
jgi:hypothetical protein